MAKLDSTPPILTSVLLEIALNRNQALLSSLSDFILKAISVLSKVTMYLRGFDQFKVVFNRQSRQIKS